MQWLDVHHPLILKSLFFHAIHQGLFSHISDTKLNLNMCFSLIASLFLTEQASPAWYSTTLVDIQATKCFPDEVLDNLLSFFENFDL